jgi:hypothetical protein
MMVIILIQVQNPSVSHNPDIDGPIVDNDFWFNNLRSEVCFERRLMDQNREQDRPVNRRESSECLM